MNETLFWSKTVRPALISFGVLHRVENTVETGTPDVTYCLRTGLEDGPGRSGWIELKHAHGWPKRPNTTFRFSRYTKEQAEWLHEWHFIGGKACLIAKIGNEYLLIPGDRCVELWHGGTRRDVMHMAAVQGIGTFPTGRMLLWLTAR